MLKKLLLLFCFSYLYAQAVQAQKEENVWLCGTNTGLDFNSGTPPDSIGSPALFMVREALATYCDPNTGALLFYTEGDTAYNKNGAVMPNGAKLTGDFSYTGINASPTASTAQGALIVPMPDHPGKYYIFSLTQYTYYVRTLINPSLPDKSGFLYYSVVDMSLDGGLGDVVAGQKGIPVDTVSNFTEHMIGVTGNRCNAWVILLDPQKTTTQINRFKAFEVTTKGVDTVPVISNVFTTNQSITPIAPTGSDQLVGKMSISSNRQKLAVTILHGSNRQRLSLFDFDANTGLISNPLLLDTAYTTEATTKYYGVAFSPDNSKLYAATWTGTQAQTLFQFDISSNNANTIIGTRTKIAVTNSFSDVKLGPDGKIYYRSSYAGGVLNIGAVNFPNLSGSASQRDSVAVRLAASSTPGQGFPNAVPVIIVPDTLHTAVDTSICPNTIFQAPPGFTDYTWNNGDTAETQPISQEGTYWVYYKGEACQRYVDTFHIQLINLNPTINVNVFNLGTTTAYDTYQWMLNGNIIPRATDSVYTVSENGDYQVIVSRDGCTDTSDIYPVTNVGIHDAHLLAEQVNIYPNPTSGRIHINAPIRVAITLTNIEGKVIKRESNTVEVALNDLAPGMYLLHITDKEGALIKVEKVIKSEQ